MSAEKPKIIYVHAPEGRIYRVTDPNKAQLMQKNILNRTPTGGILNKDDNEIRSILPVVSTLPTETKET